MQRLLLEPISRWRQDVCGLRTCPFVDADPQAYSNLLHIVSLIC